jgi:hypothetical protein
MTSKPVSGITIKGGKVKSNPPRMAAGQKRNKAMKAAREEKAWKAKSKS